MYKKLKLSPACVAEPSEEKAGADELQAKLAQCFSDKYYKKSRIFQMDVQDQQGRFLEGSVFFDFVDRYIIKNLRTPGILLPAGLIDDGMQQALQTQFQQHVYCQGKEYHKRALIMNSDETLAESAATSSPQSVPSAADLNATLAQRSRKSVIGMEPSSATLGLTNSLELVNFYFQKNITVIVKDLLKQENDGLFKLFYHTRWFHVAPVGTAPVQLSSLYRKFQM